MIHKEFCLIYEILKFWQAWYKKQLSLHLASYMMQILLITTLYKNIIDRQFSNLKLYSVSYISQGIHTGQLDFCNWVENVSNYNYKIIFIFKHSDFLFFFFLFFFL